MKSAGRIAALSGSVLLLAGCAGIPTAVSVAGMYVNSLLMLRTSKGVADHAVSAAMEQDCGFVNIMEHGAYCIDAPAPQLLAAMTADADMLVPAASRAPVDIAAAVAPIETPPLEVVAAAPPLSASAMATRTVTGPILAEPPGRKPSPPSAAAVAFTPAPAPAYSADDHFMVVLASYRNPAMAAAHAARLKRQDAVVTPVEVHGEAFHRVALRAASQPAALRLLSQAKASGASGAWVAAAAGGSKQPAGPSGAPKPARPAPSPPAYAASPSAPLL